MPPVKALPGVLRTGSGASEVIDADDRWLNVMLSVTAVTGVSPVLAVRVLWSFDGSLFADADPPDVFAPITAVGARVKQVAVKGEFYRVDWTITGTVNPTFTFSVAAVSRP
jgi:hypothetical protein